MTKKSHLFDIKVFLCIKITQKNIYFYIMLKLIIKIFGLPHFLTVTLFFITLEL